MLIIFANSCFMREIIANRKIQRKLVVKSNLNS